LFEKISDWIIINHGDQAAVLLLTNGSLYDKIHKALNFEQKGGY
jgi:hypothetical protein